MAARRLHRRPPVPTRPLIPARLHQRNPRRGKTSAKAGTKREMHSDPARTASRRSGGADHREPQRTQSLAAVEQIATPVDEKQGGQHETEGRKGRVRDPGDGRIQQPRRSPPRSQQADRPPFQLRRTPMSKSIRPGSHPPLNSPTQPRPRAGTWQQNPTCGARKKRCSQRKADDSGAHQKIKDAVTGNSRPADATASVQVATADALAAADAVARDIGSSRQRRLRGGCAQLRRCRSIAKDH